MTSLRITVTTAFALALMLGAGTAAVGQGSQAQQRQRHMQPAPGQSDMMGQDMGCGMMGQMPSAMGQEGMWHMGPHRMSPDEMREMMARIGGMMGQGMGPDMMGQMETGMGGISWQFAPQGWQGRGGGQRYDHG